MSTNVTSGIITMLHMLCRFVILATAWILVGFRMAAAQSLEYRYWKALNEGRDVSALAPVLEGLAFPYTQADAGALRREAEGMLDHIEATPPLSPVVARGIASAGKAGSDWPSMGGSPAHRSQTADPGPVVGEEAWRYPVGWPWKASPRIEKDQVFAASPSLGEVMLCLDRATGKRLWTATSPPSGFNRQARAASAVFSLADGQFAVFRESFDGWPLSFVVVNRGDGRILRRIPAALQEKQNLRPEADPRDLVAFRFEKGTQVLVKSLSTGRTWWRFSTGYLPDDPLLTESRVFAAGEDGILWGLNLWGDQRIAWTHRNPCGWGATPAERDGFLCLGGNDGAIYSFDAQAGKLRWKTQISRCELPQAGMFFSTPYVTNTQVYVGAANGFLYALDATTGQLRWQHDCGDWIRARPCGMEATVCAATLDGRVVAIRDAGTEAIPCWTARPGRFPIYADIEGDADGLLASTSDFDLVAYDWKEGNEQWRTSLIDCSRDSDVKVCADSMPDIMQAPVTVAAGRVFFAGRNGFVEAADAETGERRWRFECSGRVSGSPTTRNGRVFVGQVGGNREFYALDASTGKPLWTRDLGEVWASPECDDRQLFVGNKQGTLYCLGPATGQTQWTRTFADGVYPAPALDTEYVYTGSWDGHYYALERKNGLVVWAFSRPGRPYHVGGRPDSAAPVLAQGKVIVPNLGGYLIALNARDGRLLWEWKAPPLRICNVTAATNGHTVFVSYFGNAYLFPFGVGLCGLDIQTGRQLWKLDGIGGLTAPVVTAGNRFVVGSMGSPFLNGYQMSESPNEIPRLLWRLKTGGVMYESLPAVSGDLAFFLSNDGWLRAVK